MVFLSTRRGVCPPRDHGPKHLCALILFSRFRWRKSRAAFSFSPACVLYSWEVVASLFLRARVSRVVSLQAGAAQRSRGQIVTVVVVGGIV